MGNVIRIPSAHKIFPSEAQVSQNKLHGVPAPLNTTSTCHPAGPSTSAPSTPPGTSSSTAGGSGAPQSLTPVEFVQWGGRLPSTRRLLLSGAAATSIVLGGNLFGVSSALLALDGGKFADRTKLDRLIPVNVKGVALKRCVDYDNGFGEWMPAVSGAAARLWELREITR